MYMNTDVNNEYATEEDVRLSELVSQGDEAAFRRLFNKYHQPVFGYAVKLTRSREIALDAVQEVFMKTWLNRGGLDAGLSIKAYLFTAIRNYVFDYLKKAMHSEKLRQHILYHQPGSEAGTDHRVIIRELEAAQAKVIESLPPQRRQIFKMSRFEGLSHEEIANQLGISRNTVKDQIVKASRVIREQLGGHNHMLVAIAIAVAFQTEM